MISDDVHSQEFKSILQESRPSSEVHSRDPPTLTRYRSTPNQHTTPHLPIWLVHASFGVSLISLIISLTLLIRFILERRRKVAQRDFIIGYRLEQPPDYEHSGNTSIIYMPSPIKPQ